MSSPATEVKTDDDNKFTQFIDDIYGVESISNDEFTTWVQAYSYKGFDRIKVLKDLYKKVNDPKIAQQIVLVNGLLGPQRASRVTLLNGKLISSYGIPASGMKGTEGVSCQRITAATADLCAYLLKKAGISKRVNVACPAWLQFPSAGSLPLPSDLREQHIEFSKKFSTMIGGVFNEQIYMQMSQNTYCDKRIQKLLFDDYDKMITVKTPSASASSLSSSASFSPVLMQPPTSTPTQSIPKQRPP